MNTPRLRMFAGPNGSGKSTLNTVISEALLGVYVNPDEIEKELKQSGLLNLSSYKVASDEDAVISFFNAHPLLQKEGMNDTVSFLKFFDNTISFYDMEVNAYHASVCADFIRHALLKEKISFTFETVMSSMDKVTFLKKAQKLGYRTYLYFIATEDPIINISRVQHRVKKGGHPVPEEKIVSRYYRSLGLLREALQYADRAYIFDNSSKERVWIAQINNHVEIEFQSATIPKWVDTYLLENHITHPQ